MASSTALVAAVLTASVFSSPSFGGSCDRDEYDKADYFVQQIGRKIAAQNDGSKNVRVDFVNCDYNRYSSQYRLAIGVYWTGLLSGDSYNTDGEVTISGSGGSYNYSETYVSESLKDYRFFRGIVGLTVAIGAIASKN